MSHLTELPLYSVKEDSNIWGEKPFSNIPSNQNLKPLLIMIVVFSVSIILEFFTGLYQGVFHLMGDALHNVLAVLTLVFSFISILVSKKPANSKFSFGFSRIEVIASFSNCCFLVFLGIFLMFRSIHDALEGLYEHDHDHHDTENKELVFFNFIRLIIHLLGCINMKPYAGLQEQEESWFDKLISSLSLSKFKQSHSKKREDARDLDPHSSDMIHNTIYLFFKIGVMNSFAFVLVDFFPVLKGLKIEFLIFLCLLIYIIISTKKVIKLATDILLQGFPNERNLNLEELVLKIQDIPHVLKVDQIHYWALNPNYLVLNLNIIIQTFEMKDKVERRIHNEWQKHFNKIVIDFDIPS